MTSTNQSFAHLSDDELLATVKRLATTERRATAALVRSAGGSLVRFQFDAALLARLGGTGAPQRQSEEQPVK